MIRRRSIVGLSRDGRICRCRRQVHSVAFTRVRFSQSDNQTTLRADLLIAGEEEEDTVHFQLVTT